MLEDLGHADLGRRPHRVTTGEVRARHHLVGEVLVQRWGGPLHGHDVGEDQASFFVTPGGRVNEEWCEPVPPGRGQDHLGRLEVGPPAEAERGRMDRAQVVSAVVAQVDHETLEGLRDHLRRPRDVGERHPELHDRFGLLRAWRLR